MTDASTFLATLSQSSAAMVAIIGGFLVSRLVAISTEQEGVRRQLRAARERQRLIERELTPVRDHRLAHSISTMETWLRTALIDERPATEHVSTNELLLDDRIPRGATLEELLPAAKKLRQAIETAFSRIGEWLVADDDRGLCLEDVERRGLSIQAHEYELYEQVFQAIRIDLPEERPNYLGLGVISTPYLGDITAGWVHEVNSRRLDESIAEESGLRAQSLAAQSEIERLERDLQAFSRPIGVTSAVWILALFSLLGIVAPLMVMAFGPTELDAVWRWLLLVSFVVGLGAVLVYVVWYQREVGRSSREADAASNDSQRE